MQCKFLVLSLSLISIKCSAEGNYNDGYDDLAADYNDYNDQAADYGNAYDQAADYNYDDYQEYDPNDDDSGIRYWTNYAILPRRCIKYNGVDVIVFSMYEQKYQQCSDSPMGTYITPVPTFIDAYLAQLSQQAQDQGEEYEAPDAADYVECTMTAVNNEQMYLQVGCSDVTSKSIAVNIYEDATCETRSVVDGYDDANIDVESIQPPFKSCLPCVVWFDTDDQAVDDGFYENRQMNPPLCKNVYQYREECNKKCQKMGVEKAPKTSWNTSDKVLLTILSLFAVGMCIKIFIKRRTMSNKNSLLEQAALSAIGLQQSHIIGIICLWVLVTVIFACLGMKSATWVMLLLLNSIFFAYLMKLTVASGTGNGAKREPMIGPDGTEIPPGDDDDDSSDDDDDEEEEEEEEEEEAKPKPVGELT
mmetsp:Transcript_10930/g.16384  ORF Transcript_10930/g.16384 Transcript_10930/m.16384 type:complete len:418 (+) Transcript_10930:332-1585(+)|eukprot:CAMPEP_0196803142 /NCGR_PEP_ID=MMETSP1362-20130617/2555_1 /TAXON_ID=163516 /ORGANISM="Leptocylindrus danicus, Strain CCMP1856" /LENGTH=417 /DNA_ID=CAMNT_0042174587 /DNA_START=283 /DNA_END=1536 /DNA_ORIENTATION=-